MRLILGSHPQREQYVSRYIRRASYLISLTRNLKFDPAYGHTTLVISTESKPPRDDSTMERRPLHRLLRDNGYGNDQEPPHPFGYGGRGFGVGVIGF